MDSEVRYFSYKKKFIEIDQTALEKTFSAASTVKKTKQDGVIIQDGNHQNWVHSPQIYFILNVY